MARSGKVAALRAELKTIAADLMALLPDALTYEILADPVEPNVVWTMELWTSSAAHDATVAQPRVQQSIQRCRALIDSFENIATFDTRVPITGRPRQKS